jgi:hypothetical protein
LVRFGGQIRRFLVERRSAPPGVIEGEQHEDRPADGLHEKAIAKTRMG